MIAAYTSFWSPRSSLIPGGVSTVWTQRPITRIPRLPEVPSTFLCQPRYQHPQDASHGANSELILNTASCRLSYPCMRPVIANSLPRAYPALAIMSPPIVLRDAL